MPRNVEGAQGGTPKGSLRPGFTRRQKIFLSSQFFSVVVCRERSFLPRLILVDACFFPVSCCSRGFFFFRGCLLRPWVLSWLFKSLNVKRLSSHWKHLNGLSTVWVLFMFP